MSLEHRSADAPPQRVVVLGASGFVGRHLVELLGESSIPVLGLGSRDLELTAADAGVRLASLLRADDALVFASALTPEKGKDAGTFLRNVQMGIAVAQALSTGAAAHVVYLSSDAVYEDAVSLATESSCASPSSLYGLSHLVRERLLAAALRPARPLAVLRPCAVYGPGDTHNSYGPNRFARALAKDGVVSLFGGGEEERDHIHVRDLSRLVELCLRRRSDGLLNAATGTAVPFHAVADELIRSAGGSGVGSPGTELEFAL